jgi:multicomponent Na+:H+ antiporter subunit C
MIFLLAILVGVLYGAAVYLLLRRSVLKIILGLIFLGHATNLLLFVSGGLVSGAPPFIDDTIGELDKMADPLPQALILTAIVIGMGVTAFALVLVYRFTSTTKIADIDESVEKD